MWRVEHTQRCFISPRLPWRPVCLLLSFFYFVASNNNHKNKERQRENRRRPHTQTHFGTMQHSEFLLSIPLRAERETESKQEKEWNLQNETLRNETNCKPLWAAALWWDPMSSSRTWIPGDWSFPHSDCWLDDDWEMKAPKAKQTQEKEQNRSRKRKKSKGVHDRWNEWVKTGYWKSDLHCLLGIVHEIINKNNKTKQEQNKGTRGEGRNLRETNNQRRTQHEEDGIGRTQKGNQEIAETSRWRGRKKRKKREG